MEEKRSKSDKRSPKEDKKKKKDKDSTEGSPDTSKLTKEIASLKDKVKQARRAQKDVEPNGMVLLRHFVLDVIDACFASPQFPMAWSKNGRSC